MNQQTPTLHLARWGAITWATLIVILSLYPWRLRDYSPYYFPLQLRPGTPGQFVDAVLNFWFYFPLGFLLAFRKRWHICVGAAIAGLLLSSLVEYAQHWIPGRYPNGTDIAYNTFGAAGGAWSALLTQNALRRFLPSPEAWNSRRAEIIVLALWFVAELFPFAPSLRRTQFWTTWAIFREGTWTIPETGAIFVGFLGLATLIRSPLWIAIAFLALPAQFLVQQRAPSAANMAAALLAWLVSVVLRKTRLIPWGIAAWIVIDELRPFHFEGLQQLMTWMPGEGIYSMAGPYLATLLGKLFLFTTCLALFRKFGWGWKIPTASLSVFLLLGELLQQYLPGRTPEVTDPLLVLLGVLVLYLAERQPTSGAHPRT